MRLAESDPVLVFIDPKEMPAAFLRVDAEEQRWRGRLYLHVSLAIVTLDGGHEIVSVITAEPARRLKLEPGRKVTAVVTSTEVLLATE